MEAQTDIKLLELTGLAVGMWKRRNSPSNSLYLLINPALDVFVFLCDQHIVHSSSQTGFIGSRSPFTSTLYKDRRCIFAFEVKHSDVAGLDYSNPLVQSGRLVIEGQNVRKREFSTLEDATSYYKSITTKSQPSTPMALSEKAVFSAPKSRLPTPPSKAKKKLELKATSALTEALNTNNTRAADGPTFWPLQPIPSTSLAIDNASDDDATSPTSPGDSDVAIESETPRLIFEERNGRHEALLKMSSGIPHAVSAPSRADMKVGRSLTPKKMRPLITKPHPSADDLMDFELNHENAQETTEQESGESSGWPSPCAFTRTVHVFEFRQITATFEHPEVPGALRPVIEGNERLLKYYESGLPVWAIVMPYYGFYYRPWLRSVTLFLFYAFSLISLLLGFYDLYKTLPGLQTLLNRAFSAIWLPGSALMDWFESHTQIRLSILLTYLFGKSELALFVMRWLSNAFRLLRSAVQPVTDIIGPPVVALGSALKLLAGQAGGAVWGLCQTACMPVVLLCSAIYASVASVLMPVFLAIHALFIRPASWIATLFKSYSSVGPQLTPSSSTWTSFFATSEAFTVLKDSLVRAARSMQSVWKALVAMASSVVRHRLTLKRRGYRQWRKIKTKLHNIGMIPVHAAASAIQYMVLLVMALLQQHKDVEGIYSSGTIPAVEDTADTSGGSGNDTRLSSDENNSKLSNIEPATIIPSLEREGIVSVIENNLTNENKKTR